MNTTKELPTGLVRGEPIEQYHAADAWSKTKLEDFRRLPLYAYEKYIAKSIPKEKEEASHFRIGRSAHALVLEGQGVYDRDFAVPPSDAPRDLRRFRDAKKPSEETIKSCEWWDAFEAANKGKSFITAEDDALNKRLRESVQSHPVASLLFSRGEPELTVRVKAERYYLQCRFDWVCLPEHGGASSELVAALRQSGISMEEGEPYSVDFKTAASLLDLDFFNFQKNFEKFGYYRQGPFYRGVLASAADVCVDKMFFVATETQAPYQTAIYLPTDSTNIEGWEEIQADLKRLNACYDSGIWPGIPSTVQRVSLSDRFYFLKEKRGGAK